MRTAEMQRYATVNMLVELGWGKLDHNWLILYSSIMGVTYCYLIECIVQGPSKRRTKPCSIPMIAKDRGILITMRLYTSPGWKSWTGGQPLNVRCRRRKPKRCGSLLSPWALGTVDCAWSRTITIWTIELIFWVSVHWQLPVLIKAEILYDT